MGCVLKSYDEAIPERNQRRAGHLPSGFQERMNLQGEGIRDEGKGVDPVIHGPKLHSVPREGPDPGGYSVLFGPPSPQRDPMKPGTLG